MNGRRRTLLAAGAAVALAGCSRGRRIEATAHWFDTDFAFGVGIALFDDAAPSASIGFFQEPPPADRVAAMKKGRSIAPAMDGVARPFVVLTLHFQRAGKADFANLSRYSVLFANMGGAPVTFNRQHRDWLKDGGIELAGEVAPGGRLLGRLRRAGTTEIDDQDRPYRWDLGFDAVLEG